MSQNHHLPNPGAPQALFLVAAVTLACASPLGPQEADVKAITNVTVVPMDRDVLLPAHTVLVRDDRIVEVGPANTVAVPGDALRIDGTGKYLMPGLADLHVHLRNEEDLVGYVAHGVTTVLDMGAPRYVSDWREPIEQGGVLGPHLFTSFFVDGPGGEFGAVTTAAAATAAVTQAATAGYDYIKVYNSLTTDQFEAVMAEAQRQGIAVLGHGVRAPGMQGILDAGQIMIAHAEEFIYTFFENRVDRLRIPDAVAMVEASGAYVLPNLSALEIITLQWGKPAVVDSFLALPEARYLHPNLRERWRSGRYTGRSGDLRLRLEFLKDLTRAFVDAGVPIVLGTDSPVIPGLFPGASIHDDLRNLIDAGLTPYQALRAGTQRAGEFVSRTVPGQPVFGVVTAGARADLILLNNDPLESVEAVRDLAGVMLHGAWWSAEALHQRLDELS